MGIFNTILSKIVELATGRPSAVNTTPEPNSTTSQSNSTVALTAAQETLPLSSIDVTAQLDELAGKNKEKLNWKTSIVDLMKLLGMDSSLSSRKELAAELKYSGSTDDSASMNVWLHKQVLTKISANGGKVPAELLN